MIVVVDYRMGNIGSILNMLKKNEVAAKVSSEPSAIAEADKLILPGVGAFDTGMTHIRESGLLPVLNEVVLEKKTPLLGICLGMQLLTEGSEEGEMAGLSWIRGQTVRFRFDTAASGLKIPHMGWNSVELKQDHPLFSGFEGEKRFYFVHSYHVVCTEKADVIGVTHHGYDFASTIGKGNIFGTQYHPEKSHRYGLRLLDNFARLN